MNQRFTLDGSDDLERFLETFCALVLREVRWIVPPGKLEALMLAGGYGRGEGGVWRTPAGDKPYNDLEFYVLARGNYRQELHYVAVQITPHAGIDVELQQISAATLRRKPVSMFYHDLVVGHRWLWGDRRLLDDWEHHRDATQIPLAEARRLMVNRCTGLLLARDSRDPDFVSRNIAKAQLALGDVVLTVAGEYHVSCRERHRRLQRLRMAEPWLPAVLENHAAGVEFKLHPCRLDNLARRHAEIAALARQVWHWLQQQQRAGSWREWLKGRVRLQKLLPELLWERTPLADEVTAYRDLWQRLR